jgi:hypothetical protein
MFWLLSKIFSLFEKPAVVSESTRLAAERDLLRLRRLRGVVPRAHPPDKKR